jgi:tetratricopeptide (TPR) repeat protein
LVFAPLQAALDAFQAQNFKEAHRVLQAITSNPSFQGLPEETQHLAWQLFAQTEAQLGDAAAALSYAKRASDSSKATVTDWHLRLLATYLLNDADQYASLAKIVTDWPESLNALGDQLVLGVLVRSMKAANADSANDWYFRLLQALFASKWCPDPLTARMDIQWSNLTRELLERGREDDAAVAADAVKYPEMLLRMRIDKRFDALVARNPGHFDPVAMAVDEIAIARKMMDAHPDRLSAVNNLANALLAMEQQDEVLKLTETALAKALPVDGSRSSYLDVDTQVNWTMDYRQRALYRAGRFDEAIAIQEKAIRRPERGRLNVSQAINLGQMYYALGRPKDALAAISDIAERDVSGYGALAADAIRVCAGAQLHEDKRVQSRLAVMAAHARDGVAPYTAALLCVNDLDTLAKFYIDLLADRALRQEALALLQTFTLGEPRTDVETIMETRRVQLLARPDMQAAIAEVGRSLSWAMSRPLS